MSLSLSPGHLRPYLYYQLDLKRPSIRLIKVLPVDGDGTLRCELITEELPCKVKYAALSYDWGNDKHEATIVILCASTRRRGVLSVGRNLHTFLVQAARMHAQPLFWIDAICIDQFSIFERNHQVKQMGDIYRGATKVLIWLGTDPSAVEVFAQARKHRHELSQNGFEQLINDFSSRISSDKEFRHGCKKVWNHNYWSRVWVIQEMFLAKKLEVACGHVCVEWSYLARLFQAIEYLPYIAPLYAVDREDVRTSNLKHIISARNAFQKRQTLPDMAQVLTLCANSSCADIRDKVYAVLSIVDCGSNFPVDYNMDIYDLFALTWSYFQLWKSAGTTNLLLYALKIRASSKLQQIVERRIRPEQKFIAYPGLLGTFVHTEEHMTIRRRVRINKNTVATYLQCESCEEEFGSLPPKYLKRKYGVWCCQLGTHFRYHILFESTSPLPWLAAERYQAIGFIYHEDTYDIAEAKLSLFRHTLAGEAPAIAQTLPIKGNAKTSIIQISHQAFLEMIIHSNSHKFLPSRHMRHNIAGRSAYVEGELQSAPYHSKYSPAQLRIKRESFENRPTELKSYLRVADQESVALYELRQKALEYSQPPWIYTGQPLHTKPLTYREWIELLNHPRLVGLDGQRENLHRSPKH